MTGIFENMNKLAKTMGGEIIAFAQEKDSYFTFQCIAQFDDKHDKYTVWLYNLQFDGFYNGYYTSDKLGAYNEFLRRMNK